MEPDRIAAALEHAHPGWVVVPGYYSGYFTAIPGAFYRYRDSGMIIAADPEELERRMRLVEASGSRPGAVPPAPGRAEGTPMTHAPATRPQSAPGLERTPCPLPARPPEADGAGEHGRTAP